MYVIHFNLKSSIENKYRQRKSCVADNLINLIEIPLKAEALSNN
jgi:hypothetical protein